MLCHQLFNDPDFEYRGQLGERVTDKDTARACKLKLIKQRDTFDRMPFVISCREQKRMRGAVANQMNGQPYMFKTIK